MVEVITDEKRKARKEHTCDYCRGTINKGEEYNYARLKYNSDIYDWKSHEKCQFIAQELTTYIDPAEGITEDDFHEGCSDFCMTFVCPGCIHHDENEGCDQDEAYCIDKIYDILQTHSLELKGDKNGILCFMLQKREE